MPLSSDCRRKSPVASSARRNCSRLSGMARRSASTEAKCSIHNSSVAGSPTLPFPPLVPQICHLGCNLFGFIATHPVNKPSHRALSDLARRVGPIRPPATRPPVDHDLHNSPRVCRRSPRPAQSGCQVPWPVVPRRPDSYPEY